MDIIHGLDIETTAEKLFEVLSTDKGIADKGGSVTLRFSHTGFKAMTPVVAFTSYAWAQFLRSLKLLLETGQGEPFGSPASLGAGTTPRG